MFNYYEKDLVTWFENLEIRCRELIFQKKDIWFQTEIDLHDIEELFNSPIKYYKSGKFLIVRACIPNHKHIKKDYCLVYDENERIHFQIDENLVKIIYNYANLIKILLNRIES